MIKSKLIELLENSGHSKDDINKLMLLLNMSQTDILSKLKSDVED